MRCVKLYRYALFVSAVLFFLPVQAMAVTFYAHPPYSVPSVGNYESYREAMSALESYAASQSELFILGCSKTRYDDFQGFSREDEGHWRVNTVRWVVEGNQPNNGCHLRIGHYFEKDVQAFGNTASPGEKLGRQQCDANADCGNPINIFSQNKFQAEYDFGMGFVGFNRYYNSLNAARTKRIGNRWTHTLDSRIILEFGDYSAAGSVVTLQRGDGSSTSFVLSVAGVWASAVVISDSLKDVRDGSGALVGWRYAPVKSDLVYEYDAGGRMVAITSATSIGRIAVSYVSNQQSNQDLYGRISSVTDSRGGQYQFAYGTDGQISSITTADGKIFSYTYDSISRLTRVTYPDGLFRDYVYAETSHSPSGTPTNLTGILGEGGARFATFGYGYNDFPVSTEHAGADKFIVDYDYLYYKRVKIQRPTGSLQERTFTSVNGINKAVSVVTTCNGCATNTESYSFDANGNLDQYTNAAGVITNYDFDQNSREVRRVEAANDSLGAKRTILTTWDAVHPLPSEIRILDSAGTLKNTRNWTYNVRGQVTSEKVTDPSTLNSRTVATTYCDQADVDASVCPIVGLVKSVDGARTDAPDVVTYTYRMADEASCSAAPTTCLYRKGDLWKVTNTYGHVSEFLKYDGAAQPLSIKDQNGIVSDFEYDARGRLRARKVRGADAAAEADDQITRIEYWPTGLVKKVTQPDGTFASYTYDDAHRLTSIVDSAGNSITYTLNAAGERIKEDTKDDQGALLHTLSRTYSALGQLQAQTDAYGRSSSFTYDANNSLDQATDALSRTADNDYDPLNRLSRTLQDINGIAAETKFTYDVLDNLIRVNDPKGLNTNYTYNGIGDLTQLQSPDTGITLYTYDSAGNRKTQKDARSKTTTYNYDALSRPTSVIYTATALNTTYTYDTTQANCVAGETFSVGRLTKVTDQSGNTVYCYDRFGNLVRKAQTTNAKVFTLRYVYAVNGQLQKIVYPDNAEADYVYDPQGRVVEVGAKTATGTRQVLLTNATYYPFGSVAEWTYGTGTSSRLMKRSLNQNYQPGFVEVTAPGGLSVGYEFDEVGNLRKLRAANQADPPRRIFAYDGLNRISEAKDGSTNEVLQGYTHDKTGNRTSVTVGATTTPYTYAVDKHLLSKIGSAVARGYDANGNTTSIPGTVVKNFVYGDHNRMTQYKEGTAIKMNYVYNGRGEQVRKYTGTTNTYSLYDQAGHWLGDYANAGASAPTQQVIWFGDLPVGVLVGVGAAQKLHYIEADALGTPRVVVDPTRGAQGTAVWTWDLAGEAFGTTAPNQNPDGDANQFVFNMRFPGQRYDSATGLSQNYFRDYDAATGRYVQSDPIGLDGGISSYAYVRGNALSFSDPLGLLVWTNFDHMKGLVLTEGFYRPIPGADPVHSSGNGGATTVDWTIKSECICPGGSAWKFVQFRVQFRINYYIDSWAGGFLRGWLVRAEVLDHGGDYHRWSIEGRRVATNLESQLQRQTYSNKEQCEASAASSLNNALINSITPAAIQTVRNFDGPGGLHDFDNPNRRP